MNRKMPFKYWFKFVWRKIYPIPLPPNIDDYDNICEIQLVPQKELLNFYNIHFDKYFSKKKHIKYLEFGVFNGNSLSVVSSFFKKKQIDYQIIALDSFQGLPKESELEDNSVWKEGGYSCSLKKTKQCLKSKNINIDKIKFIEGWYKDILNKSISEDLENPDIIFIDCDTYSSTRIVLEFIKPLLGNKTLICFDDWKLKDLDLYELGESKAFKEFLAKFYNIKIQEIKSYNRKSRSFMLYI